MTARILIIAGSDSGGGAGIQADIKTVTMLGGHAMTAITAITAQNTLAVRAVHPVPTDMVIAQIKSVVSDIGVDAIKIGMIGSAETAHAVADYLADLRESPMRKGDVPLVFDPVMIATSGDMLADAETISAFERLMRIATVITPNMAELAVLAGLKEFAYYECIDAAAWVASTYGCAVLWTGGDDPNAKDYVCDTLTTVDHVIDEDWQDSRIQTKSTHGTGCTLAAAIAMGLAEGMALIPAITRARTFVRAALEAAPGLGQGHGPMGHQAVRGL